MNTVLQVVLPFPPSANAYWRTFRGRVIVSAAGRVYKEVVADLTRYLLPRVLTGPIRIHVDVFRPRRARDLDNNSKVLLDAVKGILFEDDSQVFKMTFEHWDHAADTPRVQLTVEEDLSDRTRPRFWNIDFATFLAYADAEARIEAVAEKQRGKNREKRKAKQARDAEGTQRALIEGKASFRADPPALHTMQRAEARARSVKLGKALVRAAKGGTR